MRNQDCDAQEDQNAYDVRYHDQVPRGIHYRACDRAQSKVNVSKRDGLQVGVEFRQQMVLEPSTNRQSGVKCRPLNQRRACPMRMITREFILTAILDVVLGSVLLVGVGYVALCLAPAG